MLHDPKTRLNSNGSLTVEFDEELNPTVAKELASAKVTAQSIKVNGPMVSVSITLGKAGAAPLVQAQKPLPAQSPKAK